VGQLGAGVVGAVVGSALNQPAQTWYELHYWIDFGSGPEEVIVSSHSPTHPPEGSCVVAQRRQVSVTSAEECGY
jgi:hypothetical protein